MKRLGALWAHFMQLWGQVSIAQSVVNTLLLLVTAYSTTLSHLPVVLPWWAYPVILVVGFALFGLFASRVGIPANFEYLKQRSDIYILAAKLDAIDKKLDEVLLRR